MTGNKNHQPSPAPAPYRIARGPENEPIVMEDAAGEVRYLYENGSMDEGSKVNRNNPYYEVAGCIALKDVVECEVSAEQVAVSEEALAAA